MTELAVQLGKVEFDSEDDPGTIRIHLLCKDENGKIYSVNMYGSKTTFMVQELPEMTERIVDALTKGFSLYIVGASSHGKSRIFTKSCSEEMIKDLLAKGEIVSYTKL